MSKVNTAATTYPLCIYQIKISKQGYQTITLQKEIVDNGDTEINVELVPVV